MTDDTFAQECATLQQMSKSLDSLAVRISAAQMTDDSYQSVSRMILRAMAHIDTAHALLQWSVFAKLDAPEGKERIAK